MTAKVHIRVLFFGVIRDVTGLREDSLTLPAGGNIGVCFRALCCPVSAPPRHGVKRTVLALNQEFFPSPAAAVAEGDEVAFLPPVSGGSAKFTHQIADEQSGNFYALTRDPIDSAALARRILRGEDGAIVNFEGVARNNTKGRQTRFLEYECYEAMAVKMMAQIGAGHRAEFVHRPYRYGAPVRTPGDWRGKRRGDRDFSAPQGGLRSSAGRN